MVQIWILAAQFEVRQLRMAEARKILGMSLGMCPKDRTYKAYIEVACFTSADSCYYTLQTYRAQLGDLQTPLKSAAVRLDSASSRKVLWGLSDYTHFTVTIVLSMQLAALLDLSVALIF